jgi:hypothetical protein
VALEVGIVRQNLTRNTLAVRQGGDNERTSWIFDLRG